MFPETFSKFRLADRERRDAARPRQVREATTRSARIVATELHADRVAQRADDARGGDPSRRPPQAGATLEALAELLSRHRGDRRVSLELDVNGPPPMRVRADVAQRVRPSDKLVAEVEQIVRRRFGGARRCDVRRLSSPWPDRQSASLCTRRPWHLQDPHLAASSALLTSMPELSRIRRTRRRAAEGDRGAQHAAAARRSGSARSSRCAGAPTRSARELYPNLTPWQRVLVARHPNRPNTLDYVERLFTGFDELHGDRRFADDHAIVSGLARLHGRAGRDRRAPEGARHQAEDLPQLRLRASGGLSQGAAGHAAGRRSSRRPIIVFIDTPAAYPGIESEERGVAEAIAFNLREMVMLEVPIVVLVCGEGGSGGALGIAIGDRVMMQEFSVYSVIPPEGLRGDPVARREPEGRGGDSA